MTLADFLTQAAEALRGVPVSPERGTIARFLDGPPDDEDLGVSALFHVDTSSGDTYFNPTRTAGGWELAMAGGELGEGEARLKVSV